MTDMDKYNEALERAKKWEREHPHGYVIKDMMEYIFPELADSEDERIKKVIYKLLLGMREEIFTSQDEIVTKEKALSYLEKQKEPHYTKRNALFDKCVAECDPEIMQRVSDEIDEMLEKEQKPTSTEDMPYITDEHFYEREPKDSFKYKLAEYMTRCCTKKEGPYGYEYGISAETILKMAEEELLKRGVVQKHAEWSKEDEEALDMCLDVIPKRWKTKSGILLTEWLKEHLRPSWKPSEVCYGAKGDPDPAGVWKPSEEQKEALEYVIRDYREDSCNATANYLQEILDHLKNM